MPIKMIIQLAASKQNRSKKEPTLNYFVLFEAVPEKMHSSRSAAHKGKLQASQRKQAKQIFAKSDWPTLQARGKLGQLLDVKKLQFSTASDDQNS
eukprot:s3928_g11.t1